MTRRTLFQSLLGFLGIGTAAANQTPARSVYVNLTDEQMKDIAPGEQWMSDAMDAEIKKKLV